MDKEKIGRFICALRKEQGLTQKELAERLHVSDRTVSKWERGAGLPDISTLPAPADSLGIALDELLEHRHVVAVQPDAASGQVSILLDPMDYQPLELYTLDSGTLEVVECLSLELPHEIRALQGSVYEKVQYLLFEADLTDAYAAVLFDTLSDGDRGLLSVYDRESGQAVWRGLLSLEGPYEICGIELLPQDG